LNPAGRGGRSTFHVASSESSALLVTVVGGDVNA
jgi:hypothetical protein